MWEGLAQVQLSATWSTSKDSLVRIDTNFSFSSYEVSSSPVLCACGSSCRHRYLLALSRVTCTWIHTTAERNSLPAVRSAPACKLQLTGHLFQGSVTAIFLQVDLLLTRPYHSVVSKRVAKSREKRSELRGWHAKYLNTSSLFLALYFLQIFVYELVGPQDLVHASGQCRRIQCINAIFPPDPNPASERRKKAQHGPVQLTG